MLSSVVRSTASSTKSPVKSIARLGEHSLLNKRVHSHRNGSGEMPLHVAAVSGDVAIAKLLLASGADLDAQDDLGKTALYICAEKGHETLAKYLIDSRADLFRYANTGKSCLDVARRAKRPAIVKMILEAQLHYAARRSHTESIRRLVTGAVPVDINALDGSGWTALGIAAANAHLDCVRVLLELGANVRAGTSPVSLVGAELPADGPRDEQALADIQSMLLVAKETNVTAREVAAHGVVIKTKGDHFVEKAADNDCEAVAQMIADGIPVDICNTDGFTALHLASRNGHADVVRILLDHNADATSGDALHGNCPVHYAVQGGHSAVVQLLLAYSQR